MIKDTMYKLLRELNDKGFVLCFKTMLENGNCFIRVDYGVCGTIRITDSEHLDNDKYPYSITINVDKEFNINQIIRDVISLKDRKENEYGFYYYSKMLDNKNNPGKFWAKSKCYNE